MWTANRIMWIISGKRRRKVEKTVQRFWRRSNRNGAIAGMLVGGVMVFVWKYLVRPMGGIWNIYELLPAFIFASIAIVVVSLLTKEPSKEITDEFDMVAAMKD